MTTHTFRHRIGSFAVALVLIALAVAAALALHLLAPYDFTPPRVG